MIDKAPDNEHKVEDRLDVIETRLDRVEENLNKLVNHFRNFPLSKKREISTNDNLPNQKK
jgi:hypothetical protein